jgi:hypothetical protein
MLVMLLKKSTLLKLKNGAEALLFGGNYQEGIVLARWQDELVVWHWYIDEGDTEARCEHGNYFQDSQMDQAKLKFRERLLNMFF